MRLIFKSFYRLSCIQISKSHRPIRQVNYFGIRFPTFCLWQSLSHEKYFFASFISGYLSLDFKPSLLIFDRQTKKIFTRPIKIDSIQSKMLSVYLWEWENADILNTLKSSCFATFFSTHDIISISMNIIALYTSLNQCYICRKWFLFQYCYSQSRIHGINNLVFMHLDVWHNKSICTNVYALKPLYSPINDTFWAILSLSFVACLFPSLKLYHFKTSKRTTNC